MTTPSLLDGLPLPTLPGMVHGIVAQEPWGVQCDDCLRVFSDERLLFAAQRALFNLYVPGTRKCGDCWRAAGWAYGNDGWRRVS